MNSNRKLKMTITISVESNPSLYADLAGLKPKERAGLLRSYGEVYASLRRDELRDATKEKPSTQHALNNALPTVETSADIDITSKIASELGAMMTGLRTGH
jgi:hypothetical protein